jgi:hypothetical protein
MLADRAERADLGLGPAGDAEQGGGGQDESEETEGDSAHDPLPLEFEPPLIERLFELYEA